MEKIKKYRQVIVTILVAWLNTSKQYFAKYMQLKWLLPLIIVMLILFSFAYGLAVSQATANKDDEVIVQVESGMTGEKIGQLLYEKGLFPSSTAFRIYARIYGLENSLQAGEYAFTKGMSISQMVSMMVQGQTASRQLTIPEGYTVEQIAQLIEQTKVGNAQVFKELAQNDVPYDYMTPAADVTYTAEGFLFPSTYQVPRHMTEKQLLDMMTSQFQQRFTPPMRARAAAEGLSVREVIILASLVEKEAQKAVDRPVIAGVFLNRLRQAMPLQSCATIQYILGYPKAELSVPDTELPSAYNTYLHKGLPPGPIANPGMAAIMAVLYPTATDYLYFVADKHGAHHFSKTYEEHLLTIQQVTQ
jgi:UPF0755 protein